MRRSVQELFGKYQDNLYIKQRESTMNQPEK